ncbi:MAG: hypothetical protein J0H82_18685 [Alphaproteobacteria bacterium]|nr:hypothetical protein [Alphaproteobacteria bacterium]
MVDDALVKELDRNMDQLFDNTLVISVAIDALVRVLEPERAAQFVTALDRSIAGLAEERLELGLAASERLRAWRNQAAKAASLQLPGHAT